MAWLRLQQLQLHEQPNEQPHEKRSSSVVLLSKKQSSTHLVHDPNPRLLTQNITSVLQEKDLFFNARLSNHDESKVKRDAHNKTSMMKTSLLSFKTKQSPDGMDKMAKRSLLHRLFHPNASPSSLLSLGFRVPKQLALLHGRGSSSNFLRPYATLYEEIGRRMLQKRLQTSLNFMDCVTSPCVQQTWHKSNGDLKAPVDRTLSFASTSSSSSSSSCSWKSREEAKKSKGKEEKEEEEEEEEWIISCMVHSEKQAHFARVVRLLWQEVLALRSFTPFTLPAQELACVVQDLEVEMFPQHLQSSVSNSSSSLPTVVANANAHANANANANAVTNVSFSSSSSSLSSTKNIATDPETEAYRMWCFRKEGILRNAAMEICQFFRKFQFHPHRCTIQLQRLQSMENAASLKKRKKALKKAKTKTKTQIKTQTNDENAKQSCFTNSMITGLENTSTNRKSQGKVKEMFLVDNDDDDDDDKAAAASQTLFQGELTRMLRDMEEKAFSV